MNTGQTSKTIFTLVLYFTVVFDHYLERSFFYCIQIKIFFFQLTDPFDNIIFIYYYYYQYYYYYHYYYYYYYHYYYCCYYEAYNIQKQSWPATLLKKRLCHRCFPVNFAKFLRTPFLTEHLRTTASKYQDFERLKEFIDGF